MRQLARFNISVRDTDFLLEITDDAGQVTELSASAEQLDLVIDALDELLGEDDDAFEVEDEDDDDAAQNPLS
jgi:hypothetical protein